MFTVWSSNVMCLQCWSGPLSLTSVRCAPLNVFMAGVKSEASVSQKVLTGLVCIEGAIPYNMAGCNKLGSKPGRCDSIACCLASASAGQSHSVSMNVPWLAPQCSQRSSAVTPILCVSVLCHVAPC